MICWDRNRRPNQAVNLHRTLSSFPASALFVFLLCPLTIQALQPPQDRLQAAREFGAKSDWKDAEQELRIYRNQHPDSIAAVVLHAESLIRLSQPFDAALELQKFLQTHPTALRAHELYAVLAAGTLRDNLVARIELQTCVKLSPGDFQAWKSLGDLNLDQEKPDAAVEAYRRALRLRPADVVTLASLANAYDRAGSSAAAGEEFKRAISLARNSRDSAAVQFLYGQYLLGQGRNRESVTALTKALAFNPQSAGALDFRARAYEKLNESNDAEKDALEALRINPQDKEASLLLINLYRKQGDQQKVQQYADLAQKISDEEQAQASFGRSLRDALDKAEPLLRQGQFAEAAPEYEALIKRLPTFYEAYFDLGMCYSQTGRPAEAETAFRKYLSFQPVSGDGHAALGILLLQNNRGAEAIPELEQALQIDPTLDEARKALASEYLHENKPEHAEAVLENAKGTKDVQLITMLANVLRQQGDNAGALREVRRALAIQANDPDALTLKRELLAKNGQP